MQPSIFISYRREDSAAEAGLLRATLLGQFGDEAIFMDTSSIQPGAEWPGRIRSALDSAKVVIVILGPEWIHAVKPACLSTAKRADFLPEQKAIILPKSLGHETQPPDSPCWEEWIKQQLDRFPALTEDRWAKIAAIVAGSRQRAMDRIDQFDQSA